MLDKETLTEEIEELELVKPIEEEYETVGQLWGSWSRVSNQEIWMENVENDNH